jgi:hypothetical protein
MPHLQGSQYRVLIRNTRYWGGPKVIIMYRQGDIQQNSGNQPLSQNSQEYDNDWASRPYSTNAPQEIEGNQAAPTENAPQQDALGGPLQRAGRVFLDGSSQGILNSAIPATLANYAAYNLLLSDNVDQTVREKGAAVFGGGVSSAMQIANNYFNPPTIDYEPAVMAPGLNGVNAGARLVGAAVGGVIVGHLGRQAIHSSTRAIQRSDVGQAIRRTVHPTIDEKIEAKFKKKSGSRRDLEAFLKKHSPKVAEFAFDDATPEQAFVYFPSYKKSYECPSADLSTETWTRITNGRQDRYAGQADKTYDVAIDNFIPKHVGHGGTLTRSEQQNTQYRSNLRQQTQDMELGQGAR